MLVPQHLDFILQLAEVARVRASGSQSLMLWVLVASGEAVCSSAQSSARRNHRPGAPCSSGCRFLRNTGAPASYSARVGLAQLQAAQVGQQHVGARDCTWAGCSMNQAFGRLGCSPQPRMTAVASGAPVSGWSGPLAAERMRQPGFVRQHGCRCHKIMNATFVASQQRRQRWRFQGAYQVVASSGGGSAKEVQR
jgi:hypothetical protein